MDVPELFTHFECSHIEALEMAAGHIVSFETDGCIYDRCLAGLCTKPLVCRILDLTQQLSIFFTQKIGLIQFIFADAIERSNWTGRGKRTVG